MAEVGNGANLAWVSFRGSSTDSMNKNRLSIEQKITVRVNG
jgi:hypothetical protein